MWMYSARGSTVPMWSLYKREKKKDNKKKGKKKSLQRVALQARCVSRWNFCVGVGDIGGEIRCIIVSIEGFTGGVLPDAGECIVCSNEFEGGASGEAGEGGAVTKHIDHISYI